MDLDVVYTWGQVQSGLEQVQPKPRPTIEAAISNTEVSDTLFAILSPISLLRFARTSRLIYHTVLSYIHHAFNIEAQLSRFFSNPTSFRTLQGRTNTLISGSTALQFFDRSYYPSSDLDLYTPMEYQLEVGDWLIHEGYVFRPSESQPGTFKAAAFDIIKKGGIPPYTWRGACGVFNFIRSFGTTEKKVQMIIASNSPMEIILSFHSTCVMNLISFNTAYALYPLATFEERRTLECSSPDTNQDDALAKYASRGWDRISTLTTRDQFDPRSSFNVGYRWIDDSKSWIIPLDTSQLLLPVDHPTDPCSLTNWKLEYYNSPESAAIECSVVREYGLRSRYVLTDMRVLEALREFWDSERRPNYSPYDAEFREDCRRMARTLAYQRAAEASTLPRFREESLYMWS